jgi:4-hydroxybenzoate polyprenyltransferase
MKSFIIHLRLPYMFGVLSAPYLISAVFSRHSHWQEFWIQFVLIHTLLFGGATAFNSYWDKDEGPVGGLKNPPKMAEWTRFASIFLMVIGLLINYDKSFLYNGIYLFSLVLFWVYSSPIGRWKGHPWLSLLTIGLSTGSNSFLMGLISLGDQIVWWHWITATGVSFMLTAMYPVSQVFQIDEDRSRGDTTFAVKYGLNGIYWIYIVFNCIGILLVSFGLLHVNEVLSGVFILFSVIPMRVVSLKLKELTGSLSEYEGVMRLKYVMSFSFVLLSLCVIVLRYMGLWID